jgi:hypothetical protein
MTKELKKLKPKKNDAILKELDFWQGLTFGSGFMTAVVIFLFVIIPMLACGVAIFMAALGQSITG